MGMSASQVRFLSLQHRKHNIGTQLTALSNRKMDLSRDMNRVSRNYTNALNQKVLKWSNDNGISYQQLSYDLMMSPNAYNAITPYIVTDSKSGRVVLNEDKVKDYDGNELGVTYVQLAELISSYSGMNNDQSLNFERQASYTDGDGVVGGAKAIDNAYVVPDAKSDFNFDNGLRYAIFERLGLVTQKQRDQQVSLLTELYGSPEAKDTGVYPIGSAWGDYYLALANLQAYEDFISTEQYLLNADTYKGSQQVVANFDYSSEDYIYKASVNGSDQGTHAGISYITQSRSEGGFLTKVDMNSIVANIGGVDTLIDSSSSNFASERSKLFADRSNSLSSSNSSFGSLAAYGISVSASGVEYTYSIGNMFNAALTEYINKYGRNLTVNVAGWGGEGSDSTQNIIDELEYSLTNGSRFEEKDLNPSDYYRTEVDGLIELYQQVNSHDWHTRQAEELTEANLKTVVSAFAKILRCSPLGVDETALGNAVNATVGLYMDKTNRNILNVSRNTRHCEWGRSKAVNDAGSLAVGKNTLGVGSKEYMFPDRSEFSTFVDTKPLLDTFLSFYSYYVMGGEGLSVTADNSGLVDKPVYDGEADPVFNINKSSTEASSIDTYNVSSDGKKYVEGTRTYLKSSGSGEPIYINLSTGDTTNVDTSGFKRYYTGDSDRFTYKGTASALQTFKYCDISGTEQTVYGVVETGGKVYQFNNSATGEAAMRAYINGMDINSVYSSYSSGITLNEGDGSSLTYPQLFEKTLYSDAENDYYMGLKTTYEQSSYMISTRTIASEDELYHRYLEEQVSIKLKEIEDCEADLETFYSGADQKLMDFYDALFINIAQKGWMVDDKTASSSKNNVEYLNNKLQNNDYFVTVCQEKADYTGFNYTTKQAVNVTKIFEVRDENAENVALAEYEAQKTLISSKEKKIDARMQKLETEQEAITTELQSVKKIINDNIDKTFKIFA